MVVRELITKLGFVTDQAKLRQFDKKIGDVRNNLKSLSGNLNEVSSKVRNFGAGMSLFLTAPIALMGRSMVVAASDAEESRQKFGVVFKDIAAEAEKTADNLAEGFGLAGTTARELLGDTGDLLTGFGFTGETALELSKDVNELAVDLASFTNFSGGAEGASKALTKALLGERESVKSLGISILEKDVKDQVAANTAKGMTFETNRQAKAFATLQIAQRQSQNAIGDYKRTAAGAANQFRLFSERVKDLKEKFGKLLLPIVTKITVAFIKMVEFLTDLPKPIKIMILAFLGFLAILGPIILVVGLLGQAIAGIIALIPILALVFSGAFLPFLIIAAKVIAILAVIGFAIHLLVDDFQVWMSGGDSAIGALLGNFEELKSKVMNVLGFVKKLFKSFWKGINGDSAEEWNEFLDLFVKGFKKAVDLIFGFFGNLPKFVWEVALSIRETMDKMFLKMGGMIGNLVSAIFKKVSLGMFEGEADKGSKSVMSFDSPSLGGFRAPSAAGSSKNVDIKANITLQVPHGTTAEQQSSIEESAKKFFKEGFNEELNEATTANRRNEQ